MQPEDQLQWERRLGRPAGIAAFAAGLLFLVGQLVYPQVAIDERPTTQAESLLLIADTPAHAYVPGILQALAYLATILPLVYLYRATKARRPELMTAARWLAIGGPLATAIALIVRQVLLAGAANDFEAENLPTTIEPGSGGAAELLAVTVRANERATELVQDVDSTVPVVTLQFAGVLAVAFAFVLIALNAMRAGLLSRFMGYMGVIVGVLTVLAVLGAVGSIVQIFWLLALAPLLMDRWPGGRGPAWDTVEAIPWPSAADQRDDDEEAAADDVGEPDDDETELVDADPGTGAGAAHPTSKKRRKKKKRR